MRELPPGLKLPVPPALGTRIVQVSRRPADGDPDELELLLQKIIPASPDADLASDKTVVPATDGAVHKTAIPPPYRTAR